VERLVIVAPNWLGDAVMALPAIADVRNGTRGARLAVAARAPVAPLFSLVRDVDDVITGPASLAGYDTAILLPNSFHSAMVVARAGVRDRWGYRTDWRGMLLTRAIYRAPGVHQIDSYQRLVAALGFANGMSTPRLEISTDVREAGGALLGRAGWDRRTLLVAIAPGAAYGSAKRWPPSAFADLAAGLAEDGVTTVMAGAPADRATAAEVTRALRGRATTVDVVGQTDIPALAGVLANCRALVSNDSGALHLGAALGVKVLAAFGPTDEKLSGPRSHQSPVGSHQSVVLTHDTWCRPCGLRECPLDHACMVGISAADVLAATRKVL
jgi:heptosyltransferase-2